MSFGYSIGDLITTGQFAWSLYKSCSGAPESFKNISNEVLSLHAVLKQLEEAIPLKSLSVSEQCRLSALTKGCNGVLEDLQKLVSKYDRLGTKSRRTWDRLKYGQEDIQELRSRLTSNILLINTFWSMCQYTVAQKLNKLQEDLQNEKENASIFTNETIDSISIEDRHTWRDIRKALEDIGVTVAAFESNRDFIIRLFKEAIDTGSLIDEKETIISKRKNLEFAQPPTLHGTNSGTTECTTGEDFMSAVAGDVSDAQSVYKQSYGPIQPVAPSGTNERSESRGLPGDRPDLLPGPATGNSYYRRIRSLPAHPRITLGPQLTESRPHRQHAVSFPSTLPMAPSSPLFAFVPFDQGIDLSVRSPFGETQLHAAAAAGHSTLVQLLLDNGADGRARNVKGNTALHLAATGEHHVTAAVLLSRSCEIDARNLYGQIPLICAAESGKMIVDLLLARGADIMAKDKFGHTALHYAVSSGNNSVVRTLLRYGADINAGDIFECRAAHYVELLYGFSCADMLETLLEYLPQPKAHLPFLSPQFEEAIPWRDSPILKKLVETGVHGKRHDESSVLISSIILGRYLLTQALLNAGLDTEVRDAHGLIALHHAVFQGSEESVKLLIDAGADITARIKRRDDDDDEMAPLLDRIAKIRAQLFPGIAFPTAQAQEQHHFSALHIAARENHIGIIQSLLAEAANVRAKNELDELPLHLAASRDHTDSVRLLLDYHAPINAVDYYKRSALHLAAIRGHELTVRLLLERGALVERRTIEDVKVLENDEIVGVLEDYLLIQHSYSVTVD